MDEEPGRGRYVDRLLRIWTSSNRGRGRLVCGRHRQRAELLDHVQPVIDEVARDDLAIDDAVQQGTRAGEGLACRWSVSATNKAT